MGCNIVWSILVAGRLENNKMKCRKLVASADEQAREYNNIAHVPYKQPHVQEVKLMDCDLISPINIFRTELLEHRKKQSCRNVKTNAHQQTSECRFSQ